MPSLFSKRHYEWLTAFARAELPMGDRVALCNALAREGARFNRDKFERASGITEWLAGHATRQRTRNVNAKRYHPDDYAHALHSRRERERVTGNKEEEGLL